MKRDYLPMHQPDVIENPGQWGRPGPQLPDRVETEKVLLVNRKGEPLLVERPRPIGFRP